MSTEDTWLEVRRLFQAAADLDPAAREVYLRDVPAGPVLDEVRSLLDWHRPATAFLETPAATELLARAPATDTLIGTTLGPWRIVSRIGAGGMGVVYRAVRDDAAFERAVALKIIGAVGASPAAHDRFRLERETLARLDHPSIARLLDGGTTPTGSPYFVMELVDGVPVDRYCDSHRQSVADRLAVFLRVCAAVQYAHRSLVVHRDLKPDNILVLADGTPKLLDFGVAKLMARGPDAVDHGALLASSWALTPDFASPEQVRGELVTTASDVYALGILLYLLLTGVAPYRLGSSSPGALAARLASLKVVPPSQRVDGEAAEARAAARSTTPRALRARLEGDLDAIVMKALAPDPAARYATADALVDDLHRHLHRRPVHARPRTPAYVVERFFSRHRVAVVAGACALLLAATGLAVAVWQASVAREARARAERRFDDQRALTRAFMFDVDEAIASVPGTTAARALVVKTGLAYLERLAADAGPDSDLRRELAAGFIKVGDAQGHPTSPNLGDSASARANYTRGIALAQSLVDADPADLEATRLLAMGHRKLADVLAWMGEGPEALPHAERSARALTALAERPDAPAEDRLQRAVAHIKLGDLLGNPNLPNLGRADDAMTQYVTALEHLRPLEADATDRVLRYLGIAYERVGTLHQLASRWSDAEQAYQRSFAMRRQLAEAAPTHVDVQRDYAIAYEKLANVARGAGRLDEAVTHARGALERFEHLAAQDRRNAIATRSVAVSREHLADLLLDRGERGEALVHLRQAHARQAGLATGDPDNALAPCDASRLSDRIGDLQQSAGHDVAACEAWRDAERWRRMPASHGCGLDESQLRARAARIGSCRLAPTGADGVR